MALTPEELPTAKEIFAGLGVTIERAGFPPSRLYKDDHENAAERTPVGWRPSARGDCAAG